MPLTPGRFTSTNDGLVPLSGGSTGTKYLADTGAFTTPAGGGGGSGLNPTYIANNFYFAALGAHAAGTGSTVFATTVTRYFPFWVGQAITISQILLRIATANAGNIQVSIYANSASNQPTGAPLGTTPSMSTAVSAIVAGVFASPVSLGAAGMYWLAYQCDNIVATFLAFDLVNTLGQWQAGVNNSADVFFNGSFTVPLWTTTGGTFGTWVTNPTIVESSGNTRPIPLTAFKVSSVP